MPPFLFEKVMVGFVLNSRKEPLTNIQMKIIINFNCMSAKKLGSFMIYRINNKSLSIIG